MIPLLTCEISHCQYVCELVFSVNVFDSDLGVQMDNTNNQSRATLWNLDTCLNVKGSGNMSHCRTSSLYDHLDHCFVVFKGIQHNFLTRRVSV